MSYSIYTLHSLSGTPDLTRYVASYAGSESLPTLMMSHRAIFIPYAGAIVLSPMSLFMQANGIGRIRE